MFSLLIVIIVIVNKPKEGMTSQESRKVDKFISGQYIYTEGPKTILSQVPNARTLFSILLYWDSCSMCRGLCLITYSFFQRSYKI